jgi:hypothetical protein
VGNKHASHEIHPATRATTPQKEVLVPSIGTLARRTVTR